MPAARTPASRIPSPTAPPAAATTVVLLALAVSTPALLSAQATYWAPGAVAMLEADQVEEFPDGELARWWLKQFRVTLRESCEEQPGYNELAAYTRVGRDPIEGMLNLANYMTSDLNPEEWREWKVIGPGDPGVEDARGWLRANGCDARSRMGVTVDAIMVLNGVSLPDPLDQRRFVLLLRPEDRASVGYNLDGSLILEGEALHARDALVLPTERFLRTRLQGDLGDEELRTVAREIADLVIESGISRETLSAFLENDYDGQPVLVLTRIPLLSASLMNNRSPRGVSAYDDWVAQGVTQLQRILGSFPIVADYLPDRSGDRTKAQLDALTNGISEILPPELDTALQWGIAPSIPDHAPESVQALKASVRESFEELGVMGRFHPEGRCTIPADGRFDRTIVGSVQLERGGDIAFRVGDYPWFKPDDRTRYNINDTPEADGEQHTWVVDAGELDWERATRDEAGDCLRFRIPVTAGSPGAKHDQVRFRQQPRRDIQPDRQSTRMVSADRGRARLVELHMDAERAGIIFDVLRDYARRLEVVAAGAQDPGPSLDVGSVALEPVFPMGCADEARRAPNFAMALPGSDEHLTLDYNTELMWRMYCTSDDRRQAYDALFHRLGLETEAQRDAYFRDAASGMVIEAWRSTLYNEGRTSSPGECFQTYYRRTGRVQHERCALPLLKTLIENHRIPDDLPRGEAWYRAVQALGFLEEQCHQAGPDSLDCRFSAAMAQLHSEVDFLAWLDVPPSIPEGCTQCATAEVIGQREVQQVAGMIRSAIQYAPATPHTRQTAARYMSDLLDRLAARCGSDRAGRCSILDSEADWRSRLAPVITEGGQGRDGL